MRVVLVPMQGAERPFICHTVAAVRLQDDTTLPSHSPFEFRYLAKSAPIKSTLSVQNASTPQSSSLRAISGSSTV